MNKDKQKIIVWPDGCYCYPEELESEIISGKSDDYCTILVPIEFSPEDIESFVYGWARKFSIKWAEKYISDFNELKKE